MTPKELLAQIDPKNGPKYSPNLHAWLKKNFSTSTAPLVISKPDSFGARRVGIMRSTNWLSGAQLHNVLCNGTKSTVWAISFDHRNLFENDPDFWPAYIRDGRCAIDPEHGVPFDRDETRWKTHGNVRECQWCGHHVQVKLEWTETIHKSEWVAA